MPTLIEKHLNYVVNAITQAQKRQDKLWAELDGRRDREGIIPLDDPILDEYCEAARMTASLMIDIEKVRDEYFEAFGAGSRRRKKKAATKGAKKKTTSRKTSKKKVAKKTTTGRKTTRKKAARKKAARRR